MSEQCDSLMRGCDNGIQVGRREKPEPLHWDFFFFFFFLGKEFGGFGFLGV